MSKSESKTTETSGKRGRRWLGPAAGVLVLLMAVAGGAALMNGGSSETAAAEGLTYAVTHEPLTISVSQSGTIEARNRVAVKSQVEGSATIIHLIPEGTMVEEGDLLVEMDASSLRDELVEEEIELQNAEAELISATENLAVVENQAEADIAAAKLAYEFAKQDLEKYTAEEGEYAMELEQAQAKITLAQAEMEQARQTRDGSRDLFEKKYISETELQSDELAFQRAESDYELAIQEKQLLEKYTYDRQVAQLTSDVEQTRMALERAKRKAKADIAQAEARLTAREAETTRERASVADLKEQIANCKITAPTDGMVVYAPQGNRWNDEVLEEGMSVRERQELIYLPTANAMSAKISVHESALNKVKVGQPVRLRVDALPGASFTGKVAKIAILAEDGGWRNPDLKQYETVININEVSEALRPGMTCTAEVLIAHYPEARTVPLQTVLRVDGEPTVFVVGSDGQPQPRAVEIGMDNNRKVHVLAGLEPNERVMLNPPLAAAEREAFGIPEDAEVETAAAGDADPTANTEAGDDESDTDEEAAPPTAGAEAEAHENEELSRMLRGLQRLQENDMLDRLALEDAARSEVDTALEQLDQGEQPDLSESVQSTLRMKMIELARQHQPQSTGDQRDGGAAGGAGDG